MPPESVMADALGLLDVAGYLPRYRLSGKTLGQVWGGGGGGERAVANYDEDALTMACEAALNALGARDRSKIGACLLASTSAPYSEKSSATLLATVADLGAEVLTADLSGSLRCGTTALRLALDSVRAGSTAQALVAAADMRPAAPGGELEPVFGDGAGAALVGTGDVIAAFAGAFTVSHEFTDVWRPQGERYVQMLPDMTFIRSHGLDRHLGEAVDGLLARTGRKREDIARPDSPRLAGKSGRRGLRRLPSGGSACGNPAATGCGCRACGWRHDGDGGAGGRRWTRGGPDRRPRGRRSYTPAPRKSKSCRPRAAHQPARRSLRTAGARRRFWWDRPGIATASGWYAVARPEPTWARTSAASPR